MRSYREWRIWEQIERSRLHRLPRSQCQHFTLGFIPSNQSPLQSRASQRMPSCRSELGSLANPTGAFPSRCSDIECAAKLNIYRHVSPSSLLLVTDAAFPGPCPVWIIHSVSRCDGTWTQNNVGSLQLQMSGTPIACHITFRICPNERRRTWFLNSQLSAKWCFEAPKSPIDSRSRYITPKWSH